MTRSRRSPVWTATKEEFALLVNKSNSLVDIITAFGLRAAGGNFNTVVQRIMADGLDIDALRERSRVSRLKATSRANQPIALELVLVRGSAYARHLLKRRLIKENILENACASCGQGPSWAGQPLVLVLDHINGIHDDSRLSNLRFLCPNCNSQTHTFAGRNRKPKELHRQRVQKERRQRPRKADHDAVVLAYKTIDNYSEVARKFSISEAAVRKIVKHSGVV